MPSDRSDDGHGAPADAAEWEFVEVRIERTTDENDNSTYHVYGLPEGRDFRRGDSYERFEACWLKLNGYAFACQYFEMGEYERTVTVKQDREGGPVYLETH